MSGVKSPQRVKAEQMYRESKGTLKLVDIAAQLDISPTKVRKWKSLDGWGKTEKQGERSTRIKGNAPPLPIPPKKPRGAPVGNQNAVGKIGGAPFGNKNAQTHGGYSQIYMDCLDDEEKAMLCLIPTDEDDLLYEQIQLYSIRERRLLHIIGDMKKKADLILSSVFRSEDKIDFPNSAQGQAEKELYHDLRGRKIEEEKISYLGNRYHLNTQTEAKFSVIQRLENELTRVQSAKTKAISELQRLRESRRIANEDMGKSAAVDDWVCACVGEEVAPDG